MADTNMKKIKKIALLLTLFVLPAAIFYFLIYAGVHKVNRLKFYGPKTVEIKRERGKDRADTTYHSIQSFSLTNIAAEAPIPFNSKNLEGKVYLAHFLDRSLFNDIPKEITFAASEVLPQFKELIWVTFWENSDSAIIRYTAPSERTRKFEGTDRQWVELNGNDSLIQALKTESYFKDDPKDPQNPDPGSVVLVDKEGHIRSYFNPAKQGDISNVKKEILLLYKEYELAFKTHRFIQFN